MIKLSSEAKDRLSVVINVGKTIFHWGFVPTVLYLGEICRRCMNENLPAFLANALSEGCLQDKTQANWFKALIALSAELTVVKVGVIKRRGEMFGFVTACRCCKRFSFRFDLKMAMTVQGILIYLLCVLVVIYHHTLDHHCCLDMDAKRKPRATSARSHDPKHSASLFDVTHLHCSKLCRQADQGLSQLP